MGRQHFFIGAIVGLLIGVFSTILFETTQRGLNILFPLGVLKTHLGLDTWEWVAVTPIFILIHIFSWVLIGILFVILFELIIMIMKLIKKQDKIHRIFIYAILIEIIITTILFYFPKAYYPTPCNLPNFFHPFGTEVLPGTLCIQVLAPGPSPLFFFSEYILCLTIISYFIYLIYTGLKKLFNLNKAL